jgi:hypothetical protein
MTTASNALAASALSGCAFLVAAVIPTTPADAIPWKEIVGGGAASLLLVALWMFLKFLREERADRAAERQKDREHIEKLVNAFVAESKAGREDAQITRRELIELIRDTKRNT